MKEVNHEQSDRLLKGAHNLKVISIIVLICGILLLFFGIFDEELHIAPMVGMSAILGAIMMLAVVNVIKGIYPIAYNAELDIAAKEQAE